MSDESGPLATRSSRDPRRSMNVSSNFPVWCSTWLRSWCHPDRLHRQLPVPAWPQRVTRCRLRRALSVAIDEPHVPPALALAIARFNATVVFPTPPFVLPTVTIMFNRTDSIMILFRESKHCLFQHVFHALNICASCPSLRRSARPCRTPPRHPPPASGRARPGRTLHDPLKAFYAPPRKSLATASSSTATADA